MKMRPVRINKRATATIAGCTLVFLLFLVSTSRRSAKFSTNDPIAQLFSESEDLQAEQEGHEDLACQRPKMSLYSPDLNDFFETVLPLDCERNGAVDWVQVKGSQAWIKEDILKKYSPVQCQFTELIRKDDYHTVNGKSVTIKDNEPYTFLDTDYVEVNCAGRDGADYKTFLAAPRENIQLPEAEPSTQNALKHPPLNVLVWGQDSLSRLTFIRKLPKSWKYIKEELDPIVLRGYNIIGDGTPQALTPILTGKTETELPEARSEMGDKANFVDVYPFIWNEFEDRGYLTGFLEDQPTTGCFSHRHKGFNRTPTDFYMRTFFLAVDNYLYPLLTTVFSYMWPNFCLAATPIHKVMMDYFTNIVQTYSKVPKFLFAFRSEQSHNDLNAIQGADDDLKDFLKNLKDSNALNNSILVIMSDHGARFQAIRETMQGKFEERLPMFAFIFPPWFKEAYPIGYNNFKNNSNRLVTPFDIHHTLQDIYQLGHELPDIQFKLPNEISRAMSLFKPIPTARTCADADVEPHWCACLNEETLPISDPMVTQAAEEFVRTLNKLTEAQRSICEPLRLNKVLSASKLIPSKELLKFHKSADRDGRVPNMGGDTQVSSIVLQLRVETVPGEGHYEVTMTYDRLLGKLFVKETDISRTNKYGSQADCVAHVTSLSYLRKYCYCRHQDRM